MILHVLTFYLSDLKTRFNTSDVPFFSLGSKCTRSSKYFHGEKKSFLPFHKPPFFFVLKYTFFSLASNKF